MTTLNDKQKAALTAPVVVDTAIKVSQKTQDEFLRVFEEATRGMDYDEQGGVLVSALVDFAGHIIATLMEGGYAGRVPMALNGMLEMAISICKEKHGIKEI